MAAAVEARRVGNSAPASGCGEPGHDRHLRRRAPRSAAATRPTGPAIRLEITDRKTLSSGGILPLALGIPAALAVAAAGLRLRRAR